MTDEQEQLYQHTISSLLQKVDKRDATIEQLRRQISELQKRNAQLQEEGCYGNEEGKNH